MARPGDCILVYMMQPQAVGSYFDRKRWPLHLTLLPWFSVAADRQEQLRQQLTSLARLTAPVPAVVGPVAQFGPAKTVAANVLADQTAVQQLHQTLFDLVRVMQLPLLKAEHVGSAFTAHITRYEDRAVNAGETFILDSVYEVQLQVNNTCQIIARYDLEGVHA